MLTQYFEATSASVVTEIVLFLFLQLHRLMMFCFLSYIMEQGLSRMAINNYNNALDSVEHIRLS